MISSKQQWLKRHRQKLVSRTSELESVGFMDLSDTVEMTESLIETSPYARSLEEREKCLLAHKKLIRDEQLSDEEQFLYEAIVLPTERPAVLVKDGSFSPPPAPWEHLYEPSYRPQLEKAIASVGRVEVVGTNSPPYAGTAFVVGDGLLMTNQHVAKFFSTGRGTQIRFKGHLGSKIDFLREHQNSDKSLYHVSKVEMWHPYWDMALLRVEGLNRGPLKLKALPVEECFQREIVVVGYPARDGSRNAKDVQKRIFGNVFGVKRFRPGYATGKQHYRFKNRDTLGHDASTLGGDSGSAVIDVETGHVLGLHFAGKYGRTNHAVPAVELARDQRLRDAGVEFASGTAESPNPWKDQWETAMHEATPNANTPASGTNVSGFVNSISRAPFEINVPIQITVSIRARESLQP